MKTVFWIASFALLGFGIYIIIMNWAAFINNHILKRRWASSVPLIGGLAGSVGIIMIPVSHSWYYSWIPLLVDWGVSL